MPHSFWFMIATTPWWIYLFVFCAIRVSIFITKPRLVNIRPFYFAILPLPFFAFTAIYFIPPSKDSILFAIPLLIAGILFSLLRAKWLGVKAVPKTSYLLLPGSWTFFVIIISIFIARQYIIYYVGLDIVMFSKAHGQDFLLPAYTFAIGITSGQLWYFSYLVKNGPYATHDDLKGTHYDSNDNARPANAA